MTGSENYLLDAGWLFFGGWSLIVFAVSVIAFGKDLASRLLFGNLFGNHHQEPVIAETRRSEGGTRL